ncbi:hypothetical protein N177_0104 [Lutibaculum baratangense AMV1]|uniref:Uncharacterized protein n=1 Tax=Lutibaculum baratangense AMV1 TaxID=631454 RepID=V4RWN2_9HYPH|nr:hypothetical protein N177_0104 [Lutibaculum baratangense AMV1]
MRHGGMSQSLKRNVPQTRGTKGGENTGIPGWRSMQRKCRYVTCCSCESPRELSGGKRYEKVEAGLSASPGI